MANLEDNKDELITSYERRIYDLEQLLDISRSFNSTLDSNTLIESILFSCMAQLHVNDAGIFVADFFTSEYLTLKAKQNILEHDKKNYQIPLNDPTINILKEYHVPITLEELKSKCKKSEGIKILASLKPTLLVPLVQKNQLNGLLFLGERFDFNPDNTNAQNEYTQYEKDLANSIGSLASVAINNSILIERSSTDMMTQLKLKYFFFNVLTEKLNNAMAQKSPLSVIMFDIDFFKHFNDTYGHECGDYVLKKVAFLIKDNLRENDLASRYGGEEFTVLLDDTPKDVALAIAERIRSCIENFDFVYNNEHMHVTISCGVAVFDHEKNPITNPKFLVNQADQGLYMSKHNGRNRVTYAPPSLATIDEDDETLQ